MTKQNLSILIIGIISVLALVFSLIRVIPFEVTADTYTGVIVTLLSVVVTIIIGYQIFNIIEFKDKLNSQIDENKSIHSEILKMKEDVQTMKDDLQKRIDKNEQLSLMRDYENEAQSNFKSNPEMNCISSISSIMSAIYYGLECDCRYMNSLFYEFRQYLTYLSAHALHIFGCVQNQDGMWYVCHNSETIPLNEWIDEIQCANILLEDERIRKHKKYDTIKYEYGRIMKVFKERIDRIKDDHLVVFTPEENQAIMDDSPLGF